MEFYQSHLKLSNQIYWIPVISPIVKTKPLPRLLPLSPQRIVIGLVRLEVKMEKKHNFKGLQKQRPTIQIWLYIFSQQEWTQIHPTVIKVQDVYLG